MPRLRLGSHLCFLVVVWTLPANAATPTGPVIPGYERFFKTPDADSVMAGRLLLTELNCVSCHRVDSGILKAKPAPVLTHAGERLRVEWLLRFLDSPHGTKPGTTMPDMLASLTASTRKEQVTKLVHFLASTGSSVESTGDVAAVRRGEQLFHQAGCVACHAPQREDGEPPAHSVPLGEPHQKYTMPGLMSFLKDPLAVRAGGRMPSLNLDDNQARDLASYFYRGVKLPANLRYSYFEGNWQSLPDFSKLKAKQAGESSGFDLRVAERGDNFALVFEGFIQIPAADNYRFYLGSDDGSRLVIDGREVVAVDGVHPHTEKMAQRKLRKGPHEVRVEYFEAGGHNTLAVEVQAKKMPRQPLASIATLDREPPAPDPDDPEVFQLDPELAAQGREVFASVGCASCHALTPVGDADPVQPLQGALTLGELQDFESGCLSEQPQAGLPRYILSSLQKNQLRKAITSLANDSGRDANQVVHETFARLNCYACHQRNKLGGVGESRSPFFGTTMKEMGDEGRLPPGLDGVGDKLTEKWLTGILANGANDRPYMLARMPKFGQANAGHLTAAFRELDLKTEAEVVDDDSKPAHLKAAGRRLVGAKGLGCIKCHTFGPHAATGIQAIDLTTMSERLREDWWFRYMENPQVYRPGTRMPASWPFGNATIRDVLDASAPRQMNAVWLYLKDGAKSGIPLGLNRAAIVLEPKDEPIIYRNFIEGVSPRAIAVGYPEKVNLCFDAEQFCLALLWQNDFIDASKHWVGRGPGNQRPLGDNVVSLVRGVPFAVLDSEESSWPDVSPSEAGYRFRGYRFDSKRRPVFRYSIGGIQVEDAIRPAESSSGLASFERRFTLLNLAKKTSLVYRVAAGREIRETPDGAFVIDGQVHITLMSQGRAQRRDSGGRQELLLPVSSIDGKTEVQIRYEW